MLYITIVLSIGSKILDITNFINAELLYNTLPYLFCGSLFYLRHRATLIPFGRGRNRLYPGEFYFLQTIFNCCADLLKMQSAMLGSGLLYLEKLIPQLIQPSQVWLKGMKD